MKLVSKYHFLWWNVHVKVSETFLTPPYRRVTRSWHLVGGGCFGVRGSYPREKVSRLDTLTGHVPIHRHDLSRRRRRGRGSPNPQKTHRCRISSELANSTTLTERKDTIKPTFLGCIRTQALVSVILVGILVEGSVNLS